MCCEKTHKKIIAAISIISGAGGIALLKKEIDSLKKFISTLDNSSQIILIGMILIFILLFSVFVIKPITLALIRWITFKKIHKEEVSNAHTTSNRTAHKKMKSLSKAMYSELDEIDKESKEDSEKIKNIVDYQEKRKKE